MVVSINLNIIITYTLSICVFIHSYKFRGLYKTLLLLFGAVIIGGGIENANTIFGGYEYRPEELTIMIGMCPLDVIFGCYVLIYCSSYMSHALIGKFRGSGPIIGVGSNPEALNKQFFKDTILRAALAGYIAISLDFLIDPVAVANKWWVWFVDNIYMPFEVPLGNYFGWWMLVFFAVVIYDTIMAFCSLKNKSERITSFLWAFGAILVVLFTGLLLMGVTYWWSMDGVRTTGLDTGQVDATITPERIVGIGVAVVMVFVAVGLIMAASFVKNKAPEPRPTSRLWFAWPAILMLAFWTAVIFIAALTSWEIFMAGIIFCAHYLILCLYLIFRLDVAPETSTK